MRSVSTSQAPMRAAATVVGGGLPGGTSFSGVAFSSTFGVQKTDSLRLPDEVVMTQPVSLGNISVVLAAGTRWVRAVATLGDAFASPSSSSLGEATDSVVSISDLAGSISCMHAVSMGGAGATAKALGVVGTSHGTVRFFVIEVTSTSAGPKIAHRVLKTLELSDASSNQLSLQDTVVSVALIASATGCPEALFVASRHCLLALSLRGMVTDVATKPAPDLRGAGGAARAHCSIHNEAPIVQVLPLLSHQSSFGGSAAGHRTGTASGSALNSVADHCVVAVVVFEDGSLQYLLRTLGHDDAVVASQRHGGGSGEHDEASSRGLGSSTAGTGVRSHQHAVPQLQYVYRLGPRCLTMSSQCNLAASSTRSLVVVNGASLDFDEVGDCFNVILCGVEIANSASGDANANPSGSNGLFKTASSAGMFAAPSSSQYAFASQSPYATKSAWWGVVRSVVPLSTASIPEHLGLADSAFTIPSLMHDARYLEVVDDVVAQWASQATAHVAAPPPRQSTATPIDRRGFASCSPSFNHSVLFAMGCELHGAVAHTSSLLAPQQLYTFASTLNACNALGGWVTTNATAPAPVMSTSGRHQQQGNNPATAVQQRFVASTGNSLHLLTLTLR